MGALTRFVQKAVNAIPGAGRLFGGSNVAPWVSGVPYAPHEPFAGAWQRNIEAVDPCSPSILAFPAVFACVTVIAGDVAKLPIQIERDMESGGVELFKKSPYWRLMHHPNSMQTRLEFMQHYVASKLINGNTYVLMLRDERGVVNRMYVLDPRKVMPLVAEETGDIFYALGGDPLSEIYRFEENLVVPARDILHDKMVTLWHPLIGVSPLFSAAVSAMTGGRIMINSEKFFANMSRPSGVLTAPGKIGKVTAERLKDQWEENYSRGNFGRTAILGDGLEYKPLTINATDAQLIEQLRWSSEDVARVYRVPAFMLGDLTKVSYRNSEQMARTYYQGCLQYHLEAIELAFEKAFELSNDQHIEFDLESLFRMEIDTRFKAYETGIRSGFMTINNVRAKEGLPPVPGGDEPLVQMQYVPLSVSVEQAKVNLDNAKNPPEPVAPVAAAPAPVAAPAPPKKEYDDDEEREDDDEMDDSTRATVVSLLARARGI